MEIPEILEFSTQERCGSLVLQYAIYWFVFLEGKNALCGLAFAN